MCVCVCAHESRARRSVTVTQHVTGVYDSTRRRLKCYEPRTLDLGYIMHLAHLLCIVLVACALRAAAQDSCMSTLLTDDGTMGFDLTKLQDTQFTVQDKATTDATTTTYTVALCGAMVCDSSYGLLHARAPRRVRAAAIAPSRELAFRSPSMRRP